MQMEKPTVAVIGAGPAGLMAADVLATLGYSVDVFDAMPSVARKFLMAGKSGLNITHSEDYAAFPGRFGHGTGFLREALDAFTPADVMKWSEGLGQPLFTGTSGRVFPVSMKGSPLLRAWLAHLAGLGVKIHVRHRWIGSKGNIHQFQTPEGLVERSSDAVIFALGGASWPRLGSDAAWLPKFIEKQIAINSFKPANCGFERQWSQIMLDRFAGEPVKGVAITTSAGRVEGEFVISTYGVEGSLIYAHAQQLRDDLERAGTAEFHIDLAPGRTKERLVQDHLRSNKKDSFSNRLRKAFGLSPVKAALLREICPDVAMLDVASLAKLIKALPVPVDRPRPIAEAISSAGGISLSEVNSDYMLINWPGAFVAGEMLDWEAPTGGYLLTACFATGRRAGYGVDQWLKSKSNQ
jgi:uncharacterized flavoprotein (TIGR03862 family)